MLITTVKSLVQYKKISPGHACMHVGARAHECACICVWCALGYVCLHLSVGGCVWCVECACICVVKEGARDGKGGMAPPKFTKYPLKFL